MFTVEPDVREGLDAQARRRRDRRHNVLITALVVLVAGVAGGYVLRWATEPTKTVTKNVTSVSSSAPGTVSVEVSNITGARGSTLAAVLYRGKPGFTGGDAPLVEGLGGFRAPIDYDPAFVTNSIRQGTPLRPEAGGRPVALSRQGSASGIASVPPGTHTLVLWVSSRLQGYGDWTPGTPVELACFARVTVSPGANTDVRVNGVPTLRMRPDQPGMFDTPAACAVG